MYDMASYNIMFGKNLTSAPAASKMLFTTEEVKSGPKIFILLRLPRLGVKARNGLILNSN
jgi:hypothetical protein